MSGYIKIQRKFFDHPLWEEKRVFSKAEAWIDLIRSARFEKEPEKVLIKMNLITINRGEIRASLRFLAVRWSWSKDKVSRFLNVLENETMISRDTRQGETILIILNYNKFNQLKKEDRDNNETSNETATRQQRDNGETAARQTKEGIKKEEEIKEGNTPVIPKGEPINYQKFVDLYHKHCPSLQTVSTLSESRKRAIKTRVNEHGKQKVAEMLERAGRSEFLSGKNDRKWKANLDWLLKPSNFVKVLDGCYDSKDSKFRNSDVKKYDDKL